MPLMIVGWELPNYIYGENIINGIEIGSILISNTIKKINHELICTQQVSRVL